MCQTVARVCVGGVYMIVCVCACMCLCVMQGFSYVCVVCAYMRACAHALMLMLIFVTRLNSRRSRSAEGAEVCMSCISVYVSASVPGIGSGMHLSSSGSANVM